MNHDITTPLVRLQLATIGKGCGELFKLGREALVERLVRVSDLSRVLDRGRNLMEEKFAATPMFSPWDAFCDLCPMDKAIRDMVCGNYREKTNLELEDPGLWHRLTVVYRNLFRQLLEACFEPVLADESNNAS